LRQDRSVEVRDMFLGATAWLAAYTNCGYDDWDAALCTGVYTASTSKYNGPPGAWVLIPSAPPLPPQPPPPYPPPPDPPPPRPPPPPPPVFTTLPHVMDFDFKTPTSTALFDECWSNDLSRNFQWTGTTGDTPSPNTGPANAHSPDIYYYTEASSPRVRGDTAVLTMGCNVDTSSSPTPWLQFYYHMYGAGMGSLNVDIYTSSTGAWQLAEWTRAGQQHASSSSPWSVATVVLPQDIGMMLRFRGVIGSDYHSDMAIDSVRVS
jgi:hypothetical protein